MLSVAFRPQRYLTTPKPNVLRDREDYHTDASKSSTRDSMRCAIATVSAFPNICNWLLLDEMPQAVNVQLIQLHFSTVWGRGSCRTAVIVNKAHVPCRLTSRE
ncbi:hypothetical protein CEK26_003709 [Fusarium fujikuroi]|uniref:Uncharacterized protein n=1 Tax=Fusarium fujikuroi TaxID=5127 RepID=A0A5Q3DWS1_FUSFU|nr:hypothetical protein CEK27_003702 [Fusarium fujikuroi]QGJ02265.1 hypothetical protein CEK26_003709 [Fusarium fujikuroi]VTT73060.1 unnamed protein product [Fusarium fujikuroi]VTT79682.1 unnamed protein product [Fusarium fujikuroi]